MQHSMTVPGRLRRMSSNAARTRAASRALPCGVPATARRDMISLPAPICGLSSRPSAANAPERVTARQCRDVVPKSAANSKASPVSGRSRERKGAATGKTRTSIPGAAGWRQASRMFPASSSGESVRLSASEGGGGGERKCTRHRPQRPSPELSAGGRSPGESQIV